MILTLISLLAAAPAPSPSPATTVSAWYVEEHVEKGPRKGPPEHTGIRKTWIADGLLRVESGKRIDVYDAKRGRWRSFDPGRNRWQEVSAVELANGGQVPMTAVVGLTVDDDTGEPRLSEPAFHDTGRTATIAGLPAREWHAVDLDPEGGDDTVWIAATAPVGWIDLQRTAIAVFPGSGDIMKRYAKQIEALGGYPVKTERSGDGEVLTFTVMKFERVEAPMSLFDGR